MSLLEQRIPIAAPDHLDTFHPAPRNAASSSWMIFPFPRTGPSSRCRLQLMTKISCPAARREASVNAPKTLRLVAFAVAQKRPDFAMVAGMDAAILEVAH